MGDFRITLLVAALFIAALWLFWKLALKRL
jgi:hypothetical protein